MQPGVSAAATLSRAFTPRSPDGRPNRPLTRTIDTVKARDIEGHELQSLDPALELPIRLFSDI
jgi:hypothetical protein